MAFGAPAVNTEKIGAIVVMIAAQVGEIDVQRFDLRRDAAASALERVERVGDRRECPAAALARAPSTSCAGP